MINAVSLTFKFKIINLVIITYGIILQNEILLWSIITIYIIATSKYGSKRLRRFKITLNKKSQ